MKSVLVLSGGMDSTTLLYKLLKEGKAVFAISFNYGQRHSIELERAKATCEKLGVDHKIVDLTCLTELISNSSLTSDKPVPEGHYEDASMQDTVVPNRNAIMGNIAIGYAVNIGAAEIALGVHAGDHAIYPDCTPAFINALITLAYTANYQPVNVYVPYLHGNKGSIIKEGLEMGVDYSLTHTCYKGDEKACGVCGSCQERIEGFIENNTLDPIAYDGEFFNSLTDNKDV